MKKLFNKSRIIVLLIALMVSFFSAACLMNGEKGKQLGSYLTGGTYTALAEQEQSESEGLLKELKAKVSTDGKYLLLMTAFDDTYLKADGLYYIGYKYDFNGSQIDTTQLPDAKTATYYGAVALNTQEGVVNYGAKEIYNNDAYENYGLIVYEIEFENSYQQDIGLVENIRAFITEVQLNQGGGYDVVDQVEGDSKISYDQFRVANSNFDNGIEGWTFTNLSGDAPFAGVHANSTFWGEGYAMNNVGNYFSSYADGASEASTGRLASPLFKVGGTGVITYMFGGAGNQRCFITIEDENGNVLELYRNTKFADLPAGEYTVEQKREMIGNTVFLANFVTYKADLSKYLNQQVRLVVHDLATEGWGVVFFDELNTFYAKESQIPENAVVAENLLADKTALFDELVVEIKEQGDYTQGSYNAYEEKLNFAKEIATTLYATQQQVDDATVALTNARNALEIRPVEEVANAIKEFRLASNDNKVITLADYVNENGLSSISYIITSNNAKLLVSDVVDGAFTITSGEITESVNATVTVQVLYKENVKLTVELYVQITNELAPTVYTEVLNRNYDVYLLDNKQNITINFAENVDNPGDLELTYSATYKGEPIVLDGSTYTFNFNSYNGKVTVEAFEVSVSFTANNQADAITYVYNLNMVDSTENRLVNGGFEDGLEGWTKVGNIGDVDTASHYWVEEWENNGLGYEFGMDGQKMFSAYAVGATEASVGTLTSSTFVVGGSGFITFKVGAMKDGNYVYVDVVDAENKQILARYYNGLWQENTDGLKSGCTLIAYKADLSAFDGKEVFFRISDNADSGYGLFFADSFNTYYETEPQGFENATAVSYQVTGTIYDTFNGGFELGDVQGWWNMGTPGHVTNANAFFNGREYGKNGDYLYSGVEDHLAGNGLEGNKGVLTSSVFEIGGTGYISYMLGGGGNELCYVQVIDAVSGEIIARYRQQAQDEAVLIQYVANLGQENLGRLARFQVVDYAFNNWGCVSFDNLVTYYASTESLPQGQTANDIFHNNYQVTNGSFETGNIDGWNMAITEAGAFNTLGWVLNSEIDAGWYVKNDGVKDGNFLFTFAQPNGDNCENTKGTLSSSVFTLKQNTFVSFKFGGAGTRDVYIQLCRVDGEVIATFYNEGEGKINTNMLSYYYQYSGLTADCFFRVVDNSTSNYGCFVVDDFKANLASAPAGYLPAILP